jgi:hypothetical protein
VAAAPKSGGGGDRIDGGGGTRAGGRGPQVAVAQSATTTADMVGGEAVEVGIGGGRREINGGRKQGRARGGKALTTAAAQVRESTAGCLTS